MRSNLQATVAGNLRAELARRDLTQQEIADQLGISSVQVSRRMRGEVDWRLSELEAVAELLGLGLRDLLPVATPSPTP